MKDRDFVYLAGTCLTLIFLWMAYKKRQASGSPAPNLSETTGALPIPWASPMDQIYDANPAAYAPATPESLTINVANQTAAELSNAYMPLFGFVGVAQGQMYD